jgi:hypothetical protein
MAEKIFKRANTAIERRANDLIACQGPKRDGLAQVYSVRVRSRVEENAAAEGERRCKEDSE